MYREDVTTYQGKEYVSIEEFAKRVGAGKSTIKRKLSDGKLHYINIEGRKTRYLDWEASKRLWDLMPHDAQKINAGKRSNAMRYGKVAENAPKAPTVNSPTVRVPDLEDEEMPNTLDLAAFDKTQYSDCVVDGEFDYEKLKTRLTAETYQQKLHKERGQLVEREEIVMWAQKLGTMLHNNLETIPQKYTAVLIAQVQTIVAQRLDRPDFEFTPKERSDLRETLKSCGPDIMRSMRKLIMEMEE